MLNVQINKSLGKHLLPPGWHWDNLCINDFDLWLALGGEGEFYIKDQSVPISRGSCFIMRPGKIYSLLDAFHLGKKKATSGLYHIYVHFNLFDKSGNITKEAPPDLPEVCHLQQLSFIEGLLTRAVDNFKIRTEKNMRDADFWLTAALDEIIRQSSTTSMSGTDLLHAQIVDKVCALIDEAPGKDFRVDDLARTNGYSLEHFCRIFKKTKGISPNQYIVQSRLEFAKSLLLTSSMTVSEIAAVSGYNDVYFFSRQFSEKNGLPPSKFRTFPHGKADKKRGGKSRPVNHS